MAVVLARYSGLGDEPATQATATVSQMDDAGSRDASAKGVIYGIYKVGDQIWFTDEGEAAKKVVEQHGDEFTYVDAKMNPEEYLRAIDNAVANQVKGIVTCISDQTTFQVVVNEYEKAGVPVVAYDDAFQNDAGDKLAPWVDINTHVIGQVSGDWLAAYTKDNNLVGDEQCGLLLLTMDTVPSCVPRAEREYNNFTADRPDFPAERIFRAGYDGTTDKGNVAAVSVIAAYPEIKKWLVTGANEEGIIGAVRTLESAGLDEDACAVGPRVYMTKDEWNGKETGGTCTKAATYFSSDSMGKGFVEVLYEIIGGREVPSETTMGVIVVTPESYREVMGKAAE